MITAVTTIKGNADYNCLIHLDRLSLTFRLWSGSTFQDIRNPDFIPQEQLFNEITLIHDTSPGLGAYYHSYRVFYEGLFVGKLHAATKLKKHELQFDYSKEVFYAFHSAFWYEVYEALITNLGILYNNIMYIEIDIDTNKNLVGQFGYLYQNTINNKLRSGDRYKLRKDTIVNVMNNGRSFVIEGTENEIALYNKTSHADNFIQEYFENNGLANCEVHRIESRLTWNYIRYLRNKKAMDINVETLLDPGKLANIFKISTINKITFKDMSISAIDCNRNKRFQSISIIDDLDIDTAEIGKLNPELRASHYKNQLVDENIMRQNYFLFLDTGNKKYFRNFKSSGLVAGYSRSQLLNFVNKHNFRYHGNRTLDITERMEFAIESISGNFTDKVSRLFHSIIKDLKSVMLDKF